MINIQMEESICCVVSYLLFLNDVSLILLVFILPAPGLAVGAVPGYHSQGLVGEVHHDLPVDQHYHGQHKQAVGDEDGAQDGGYIAFPDV